MTLELAIILGISIGCATALLLTIMVAPGLGRGRDMAARDRDSGLAKLYEARAGLMRVEELERRDAIRRADDSEKRIAEARRTRRRAEATAEVRQ